ncbi:hypothetical protein AVEN_20891-1 [Araneus ventricosus]|uniref:Uncharacterized protein n=1 Tax=Araneus ventricosus TaxID=182803 RepID=A0A4Y2J3U4_ARAVE|nr:hypothetical protein AVEN_20891-1 [Araneus ventricosus]
MSQNFGILPISQCSLSKSELIRDFKSELITQLFLCSVVRKPRSRLLNRFFSALLVSNSTFRFQPLPQGVELRFPFTPLDNRLPGRPTTKLQYSQRSTPTVGRFLSFLTTGAIQM